MESQDVAPNVKADSVQFDQLFRDAASAIQSGTGAENKEVGEQEEIVQTDSEVVTEKVEQDDSVVLFEGKPVKIEKSAKDYLLEALSAKKGMRKAFSERDKEKQRIQAREVDLNRYDQIKDVFKKKGIEGMYDALAGKEGAYADHIKKIENLAVRKYTASEDELKLIQQEELIEKERALRELAERTAKETLENIEKEKVEANKAILSTRLNEAFESVNFEGKLGNEKREAKFNRYVWDQARAQLKEYADEKKIGHHEIPVKVIRATFAEIAEDFKDLIKKEVGSKIQSQVQEKTDVATKAAQARSVGEQKKNKNAIDELAEKHKYNPHSFLNEVFEKINSR